MFKMPRFNPNEHHLTKNKRGAMHPLSEISKKFTLFASTAEQPVIDIGCAYGNTVLAALDAGVKNIIACDMDEQHLAITQEQVVEPILQPKLKTQLGIFPDGLNFDSSSLSAIHASHLFEYLNGEEAERGLQQCFNWLHSGGKLFIVTYTIYICELVNEKFQAEYQRRLQDGVKWPGYIQDINEYSSLPDMGADSPLPKTLHFYEVSVLLRELNALGFIIEFADYLDGRQNGAVEETWHEERKEYLGIIAMKP